MYLLLYLLVHTLIVFNTSNQPGLTAYLALLGGIVSISWFNTIPAVHYLLTAYHVIR